MTDTNVPTHWDLMYPVLALVRDLGGSASKAELKQRIGKAADLTEEQLAVVFPTDSAQRGESKAIYNVGWACTALKFVGAVDNSERGIWSITKKGHEYLGGDPTEKRTALLRDGRAAWNAAAKKPKKNGGRSPDADEDWRTTLRGVLMKTTPAAFERLATRLLKEAGFRNVEVLGKAGDGGIDGVGVYKVSLVSFPTYFQCKRYAGSVAAGAVRDFRGAMTGRGEKGLLITTGSFTPAARAEATRDGAPPVDLIDGDELCDLILEYRLGVDVEERKVQDVTVDADFFASL